MGEKTPLQIWLLPVDIQILTDYNTDAVTWASTAISEGITGAVMGPKYVNKKVSERVRLSIS